MHRNAEITFQLNEANELVSTIVSMGGGGAAGGGGKSVEEADAEVMATAARLLSVVPEDLDREKAARGMFAVDPQSDLMNSLDTVLSQEMIKFNRLLACLRRTLTDLQRAIKGLAVMSVELESMYNSFLQGGVPNLWSNVAYPSLKPLASWVEDLQGRMAFMRSWLEEGQPRIFALPAFYFPQGFMTAALQLHARKYKIAINTLKFSFQVLTPRHQSASEEWIRPLQQSTSRPSSAKMKTKTDSKKKIIEAGEEKATELAETDVDPQPMVDEARVEENARINAAYDDGVLCSGLYLEGARIADANAEEDDARCQLQLEDQLPRQLVSELPVIHFLPEQDHVPGEECYVCPVYKVSTRQGSLSTTGMSTNFVVAIELPRGERSASDWVLRGTAALLNLDV
jgi:dynein heavy chain